MEFKRKYYEDVLNYCTSIKGESHSLTYWEATLLRKLIHIDSTNEVIKYSNLNLAKMLFRPDGENTVKNTIGKLVTKGFITSASIKISDGKSIKTRRTIKISWNLFSDVFNTLPNYFEEVTPEVKETPVEEPKIAEEVTYKYYDEVDMLEFLPSMGFTNPETFKICDHFTSDIQPVKDIITVIGSYIKEMKYNDYDGPNVTKEIKTTLQSIINNK